MNKRFKIAALSLLALGLRLDAVPNQIIAPSILEDGYAFSHYPFMRPYYNECKNWYLDVWAAGLYRRADTSFNDASDSSSLGALFFGADSFQLSQALPPGTVIPGQPVVNFGTIIPGLTFIERTAFFGLNIEGAFGCDNEWHVGARFRIPIRSLSLDSRTTVSGATSVTDLFVLENERLNCPTCVPPVPVGSEDTIIDSYAIRLDLLSALTQQQAGVPPFTDVIQYQTTGVIPTRISGLNVTNTNNRPVHLIYSPGGVLPAGPWARTQPQVNALPCLDGAGALNADAIFCAGTNYAALDGNPVAQANYWVAPTINTTGGGDLEIVAAADTIRDNLTQLLQFHSIYNMAGALLATGTQVAFASQTVTGAGDFDTELYARYDSCCGCLGNWFAEGIFGVRFPSGARVVDPSLLFLMPAGNNHHYQLKLGGYLGWDITDWFAIKADAWYHWVLKRRQTVAAPFTGATIFGIGPAVDANVSWQYFVGDVDLTFMVPCVDPYLGFDIGYRAFVKRRDRVSFDVTTALLPGGTPAPLNEQILENNTKRVAHIIKAEIFKQTCDWQIYAGYMRTLNGKNVAKNYDIYLGLEVYF